jgi:cysteinyl-tRNA synthetase
MADARLDAYPIADRAHAPGAPLSDAAGALHRRFVDALDRDLDMPAALATVRETLRVPLADDERRWLVLDADAVLGLDLHATWDVGREPHAAAAGRGSVRSDPSSLPGGAAALLDQRATARAAGDFARSDRLRDELSALGIEVMDRPGGLTEWRIRGQ